MLTRLRQETAEQHRRVERVTPFGPGLDAVSYVAHLARRLGFQEPVEEALLRHHGWVALGLDYGARRKAQWLVVDLQALGVAEAAIAGLPRCTALPRLDAFERALGCAYVLEGATLGGRAIVASVVRRLGLRGEGCRFLEGYGEQTAARFGELAGAIERYAAGGDEPRRAAIVEGARDTFIALERWLAPPDGA